MMLHQFLRRLAVCIILWSGWLSGDAVSASEQTVAALRPFTSDGCSAFPDGTLRQQELWLSCCTAHDRAYWLGGSYSQREIADQQLRHCVTLEGEPAVGMIMQMGVRLGGSPFFPTSFRWGYGWGYPRGYRDLTAEEWTQAQKMMGIPIPNSVAVD